MNNLNQCLIEGKLTAGPDLYHMTNGKPETLFRVESVRTVRDGAGEDNAEPMPETSYFDIRTTGELATRCAQELKAGRGVRIIGRLRSVPGTDTGSITRVFINADHVVFKAVGVEQ